MSRIRADVPHFVYRLFDADDVLLYIGCTNDLATREGFRRHEAPAWLPLVARTETEEYPNRQAALIAERQAIETEDPEHNIQYKDVPA